MKLSEQIRVALESYRNSPHFLGENKHYLDRDDGRLVEKVERLEEALEFYASDDNWNYTYMDTHCSCCAYSLPPKCHDDDGELARKTLKEME